MTINNNDKLIDDIRIVFEYNWRYMNSKTQFLRSKFACCVMYACVLNCVVLCKVACLFS